MMLRVLTYHRVAEPGATPWLNPLLVSATPALFDRAMKRLARRYRVVSMEEVLDCVGGGRRLPGRSVLITFDDAYRDFGEIAWPILRRYRLPATLFVPTAYPGNPKLQFWWDRLYRLVSTARGDRLEGTPLGPLPLGTSSELRTSLKRLQNHVKSLPHRDAVRVIDRLCSGATDREAPPSVLTWDELRSLARDGVSLASHTRTHPILNKVGADEAREEIRGSREDLEREVGAFVPAFAYPAGGHDSTVVSLLRAEGFQVAFTTCDGHNRMPPPEPLQLSRTNVTPRTTPFVLDLRLTGLGSILDRWRHRGSTDQKADPGTTGRTEGPPLPAAGAGACSKVAYIMSRFPKLSETFVLYEMLAVEEQGVEVEIYPLLRERQRVVHAEAERLTERAHFHAFLSPSVLKANWYFIRRRPRAYFNVWWEVLSQTWGSLNFFVGGAAILPKSVRFAYEMQRQNVRHVHAHFANHPAVAALVVHRLTGIPFSFTAHGSDLHVERLMLGRKIEAAAFVVTVSEFNRTLMISECGQGIRDKVRVLHCGVDPEVFSPQRSREGKSGLEVLCVASFEEVKGHRFLLDACRLLVDRGLTFTCRLVGDGPLRSQVERQVTTLDLGDRVILHGGLSRPEVVRMLSESDVFVLASAPTRSGKREGIPVALMEAMAAGLPIVAGATGGIPELVESGRSGFLVGPGDVNGLAAALETLANDVALRERMGAAGRQTVLREFNLKSSARQLVQLFQDSAASTEMGRSAQSVGVSTIRPAVEPTAKA